MSEWPESKVVVRFWIIGLLFALFSLTTFKNSLMNIKDKRITILGLGKSGYGAAKLANQLGARVFVSDLGTKKLPFQTQINY